MKKGKKFKDSRVTKAQAPSRDEIFMAYDVRGRGISTHDAFLLGKALGNVLSGSCVIGRDPRKGSGELTEHVIEGLRQSGINITNIGLVPNSVNYFTVFNNYDFGVYVTGSHLPVEYNGFKIMLKNGCSISPQSLLKVKESFYKFKFKSGQGRVKVDITALNDYASFLMDEFSKIPVKCVIDCFNGATGVLSRRVFSNQLNATVIHDKPLPDFGGRVPEPSEKTLTELSALVVKSKASFGVGLDGDGDRSVFIDDKGRVLDGSKMTLLFAREVLKRNNGGVIVAPVSVSSAIESVAREHKGRVVWCKVGHTFIEEAVYNNKALFGGEESSHFYWNEHYPFSDGVLSTLMLARLLHESKKTLSALIEELPKVIVLKEEVEFPSHKIKFEVMERIKADLLKFHRNAVTIDGVKFALNDGSSVLVRASETRHTIKVFVEAVSRDKVNSLLNEYVNLIRGYQRPGRSH